MFLNQVTAPITVLLLPLTLCVQESDTKLFQFLSHYTNQFVLTVVQGFFFFFFFLHITKLSFPCPSHQTFFAAQGLPVANKRRVPLSL